MREPSPSSEISQPGRGWWGRRRLTLADLVDMEVQHGRDRDVMTSGRTIQQRDARIAERIGAADLDGRDLYLNWLDALRDEQTRPTVGETVEVTRRMLTALLIVLAVVLATGMVVGWVSMAGERPINVIHFWLVFVGAQVVLLAMWLLAILPPRWAQRVPGLGGLHLLLRWLARLPPMGVGWVLRKLPHVDQEAFAPLRGRFKQLDWLYGRLRFWVFVQQTQVFALWFNLTAAAVLMLMLNVSDPAFGWRSALLEPEQIHRAVRILDVPWAWSNPTPRPDRAAIDATRYTSLDATPYVADVARRDPTRGGPWWSAWWPFLVGSMLCYGLLPRIVTTVIAQWRVNHLLRTLPLDHADFEHLRARLKRPYVSTTAREANPGEPRSMGVSVVTDRAALDTESVALEGPAHVLQWADVEQPTERIHATLRERLKVDPLDHHAVGGLDLAADEQALRTIRDSDAPVVLIAPAWQSPVGDYLDFLRTSRQTMGAGRTLLVALVGLNGGTPETMQVAQWRDALASLGDPWLRMIPLPLSAEAAA